MKNFLLIISWLVICSFQNTDYTFKSDNGMFELTTPCVMEDLQRTDYKLYEGVINEDTNNEVVYMIEIYRKPMNIMTKDQKTALDTQIEKYLTKQMLNVKEKTEQKINEIYPASTLLYTHTDYSMGVNHLKCILINETFIVLTVYAPNGSVDASKYQTFFDSFKITDLEALKKEKGGIFKKV